MTDSETVLALLVVGPAGHGSCCPSPHRNTEPMSIPELGCSGAKGLAQGRCCPQLQDHQRLPRALLVYQHSFQTRSKNVRLKSPVIPSLDFHGMEVVLFLTSFVQQLSWCRGQTVSSYGEYVLTQFPFTE